MGRTHPTGPYFRSCVENITEEYEMPTIHELNERRAAAALSVQMLGMVNQPLDYAERLKLDARYKLAIDALMRAEQDYNVALALMPSEELLALAK